MINHSFGGWLYDQDNLYSNEDVAISLKKNSIFLEKIIEMANKNNSKINIVLYPWPGQIYKEEIDTNNRNMTYINYKGIKVNVKEVKDKSVIFTQSK